MERGFAAKRVQERYYLVASVPSLALGIARWEKNQPMAPDGLEEAESRQDGRLPASKGCW
jgi:hypothetical protein